MIDFRFGRKPVIDFLAPGRIRGSQRENTQPRGSCGEHGAAGTPARVDEAERAIAKLFPEEVGVIGHLEPAQPRDVGIDTNGARLGSTAASRTIMRAVILNGADGISPLVEEIAGADVISDDEWKHMAASGRVYAWPLRVVEKIPEGADAVTVVFDDPARHVVSFEAGQYRSAALDRAIFAAPLRHLAEVHGPRFSLRFVFEAPPPDWTGVQGRLDSETLDSCLSNIDLAGFQRAMLCGPDGMRAAARQALETRGLPADHIVEESFTSPRRADVPDVTQVATVASTDGQQTFQVKGGVTLLDAALDAGVSISFSCFSGGCGACRIQVTDHAENVVLDEPNDVSAEDRLCGNVPACLVRLRGSVTFTVP